MRREIIREMVAVMTERIIASAQQNRQPLELQPQDFE